MVPSVELIEKKGKYVAFRMPVDVWSFLKKVAKANHRSMTEQLRIILGTWNVDHPDEANPDLKKNQKNF
jgi:hypothetical protein